ncbi:MAG: hypothetical protein PVH23_04835 [candidate division WOR-3 bacterium]
MRYRILLGAMLTIFCSDNHIVQRAAQDYFPLRAEYWWRYASASDTLYVEVEPADTILEIQYYPVSYNGVVKYLSKFDNGIAQYVRKVYNYAGNDHTVLEDFIIRLELPLIAENSYQHRLSDSIQVANQLIKAQYDIEGIVVDYLHDSEYGDVYEVSITTIESLITPDTSIVDTNEVTEYYAPSVGMIRLIDGASEYELLEYNTP